MSTHPVRITKYSARRAYTLHTQASEKSALVEPRAVQSRGILLRGRHVWRVTLLFRSSGLAATRA